MEEWQSVSRRVLWMLYRLHERGYQQLRLAPGLSGSGIYWRCTIAPVTHFRRDNGALLVADEDWMPRYSSADGCECFGWKDSAECSPDELADRFVKRFTQVAEQGLGSDWAYAGWYQDMLRIKGNDGLPFAYSDGFNDDLDGIPWVGNPNKGQTVLPWAPPGLAGSE